MQVSPLKTTLFVTMIFIGCATKEMEEKVERDPTEFLIENTNHNEIEIGFKCNADGSPTEVVRFFEELIQQKSYNEITLHLNNSNSAYRVLATILTEKLLEKRQLKSNSFIERAINRNKNSWDLVYFCSGCTYQSFAPMWECFQPDFLFEIEIKMWLSDMQLETFNYHELIQQSSASVNM